MTNQEIHLRLLEAAIAGFCANPHFSADWQMDERIGAAMQIANIGTQAYLTHWDETPHVKTS